GRRGYRLSHYNAKAEYEQVRLAANSQLIQAGFDARLTPVGFEFRKPWRARCFIFRDKRYKPDGTLEEAPGWVAVMFARRPLVSFHRIERFIHNVF
ncbi:MAG TPA: hypothetical protein VM328_04165, partial [Fimbriimonadaceae bacterium]|nr:hypothetical protein [Fimbriimonadaceae bacterium]